MAEFAGWVHSLNIGTFAYETSTCTKMYCFTKLHIDTTYEMQLPQKQLCNYYSKFTEMGLTNILNTPNC